VEDPGSNLVSHSTFQINLLIGMSGCAYETRMHGSLCRHAARGRAPRPLSSPKAREKPGRSQAAACPQSWPRTAAAGTTTASPTSGVGRLPISQAVVQVSVPSKGAPCLWTVLLEEVFYCKKHHATGEQPRRAVANRCSADF